MTENGPRTLTYKRQKFNFRKLKSIQEGIDELTEEKHEMIKNKKNNWEYLHQVNKELSFISSLALKLRYYQIRSDEFHQIAEAIIARLRILQRFLNYQNECKRFFKGSHTLPPLLRSKDVSTLL